MGLAISTMVTATAEGVGSTICWTWSATTSASHITSRSAKAAAGRTIRRRARSFMGAQRPDDADLLAHGGDQLGAPGAVAVGERPGERQVHRVYVGNLARIGRQHVDGLAEEHRLAQVVGHQDAGELARLAEALVQLPHLLAGEGVEGRE